MLALSMALTLAYACSQETLLEVALRVYVRPLAMCMGGQEEARPATSYSLACIEKWKDEHLDDMQQRFSHRPHQQPLIFLSVSNVTLFGSPDDYQQYRKKPPAFLILPLRDLGVGSGVGEVHLGNMAAVADDSRSNLFTVSSVLCVIWFLSVTLTSSMRTEIIGPMERIVKIIESLVHDPLGTQHAPNVEGPAQGDRRGKGRKGPGNHVYAVERAILRVRNLLQLGLGEAGAKIIRSVFC